jgi:ketosteroid isomerase-like protein
MSNDARDQEVLRRYYALFNERRFQEASLLVGPDCTFEHMPTKEHAHGPRGYLMMSEEWLRAVPDLMTTVDDITTIEPGVYRVHITIRGTRTGTFEVPRTASKVAGDGRPFAIRATQRVRVHDGRIVSSRLTYDRNELTGASTTASPPPPCPSCGEPNVVIAWTRMHERGLFCPICEHAWESGHVANRPTA